MDINSIKQTVFSVTRINFQSFEQKYEVDRMWTKKIQKELVHLQKDSQMRQLKQTKDATEKQITINGQRMLNLASNNYLGLANHPHIKQASMETIEQYGVGATASRLIVGNHPVYDEAENALLTWKRAEAGLIVNSGYTANVGIISSLVGRHDLVFSDQLNHASIIDGIILSRAKHKRYRHNNMDHLEAMLKKAPKHKRKLIVTDTVFSMDGDVSPLHDLVTLKKQYNALLMVDEAHGTGVFGPNGEGYSYDQNVQQHIDLHMGTFSKALGCFGAYVIGEQPLIDYLTNKMRSFIFTTGLPPALLGAIQTAILVVQMEERRRLRLHQLAEQFRTLLQDYGFFTYNSETQIVPIRIGTNEDALQFSERLQAKGIAAIAIRPPTVREGDARIRFTVTANHTESELIQAATIIAAVGKELGVIS